MSVAVKRTSTFAVRPLSNGGEQLLRDLLDASAALWNEINYQRLMRYNDEDGFEDDVWDADTGSLEGRYKGVIGASTTRQVIPKNSEAWRGFFRLKDQYYDESNMSVTHHPEPRASVATRTMDANLIPSFATRRTPSNGASGPGLRYWSGAS